VISNVYFGTSSRPGTPFSKANTSTIQGRKPLQTDTISIQPRFSSEQETKVDTSLGSHATGKRDDDDPKKPSRNNRTKAHYLESGNVQGDIEKRKQQHRKAQKAYRERKKRDVADLGNQIAAVESANTEKSNDNQRLKDELTAQQRENSRIRAQTNSPTTIGGVIYDFNGVQWIKMKLGNRTQPETYERTL
jgi:hypothetical protein